MRSTTNTYLSRVRILIVEPNAFMRTIVKGVLGVWGATEFLEANEGITAFEEVVRHEPDMVISEFNLHPMNGLELTNKLRTDPRSPNPFIPVIMLTSHTDIRSIITARDRGITEFVAKPISAKTLMRHVAEVIEHPRPFVRIDGYFGPDRRRRRTGGEAPIEDRRKAAVEVNRPIADQGLGLTQTQIDQLVAGQEVLVNIPSRKTAEDEEGAENPS